MDRIDKEGGAPDESPETDSPEIPDHPVGYRKPPVKNRFKLKQTGKRPGRPLGSKNRKTIVRKIANEMHEVTEDGQRHTSSHMSPVWCRDTRCRSRRSSRCSPRSRRHSGRRR